jgi:RNA polymerase sigma-70 factor (ECF subfamily)
MKSQTHADPRDRLAGAIPKLRAFAISLARDVSRADDLVQETILKAWSNIEKVRSRDQP